eukprot:14101335-Alexandrium_andersonii.AAC.1
MKSSKAHSSSRLPGKLHELSALFAGEGFAFVMTQEMRSCQVDVNMCDAYWHVSGPSDGVNL